MSWIRHALIAPSRPAEYRMPVVSVESEVFKRESWASGFGSIARELTPRE